MKVEDPLLRRSVVRKEEEMTPIHTILHPTDFSPQSAHALQLACSLARDYVARLVVLHVAEPPPVPYGDGILLPVPVDDDERLKGELGRLPVPDGVRAERRFERGDPVTETLRVAEEISADLVVMGTHGRTGLGRLLMGSVAEQVVRQAPCPVLTVKPALAEEGTVAASRAAVPATV
jgi:nucleotide-binding universal stress UspA family protein